jgi:hypothetical protein
LLKAKGSKTRSGPNDPTEGVGNRNFVARSHSADVKFTTPSKTGRLHPQTETGTKLSSSLWIDLENELSASFSVGTFPVNVMAIIFASSSSQYDEQNKDVS